MSHHIQWIANHRILHVDYNGDVFDEDLAAVNKYLEQQFALSDDVVHVILDNQNIDKVNTTLERVTNSLPALQLQKVGMVCIVGGSAMSKLFGNFIASAFTTKVREFDDLNSAFAQLAEEDNTLPMLRY